MYERWEYQYGIKNRYKKPSSNGTFEIDYKLDMITNTYIYIALFKLHQRLVKHLDRHTRILFVWSFLI